MPKRTSAYNSWQLEKLTNPETAAAYLSAAIVDSPEMFRKALRNVAQSRKMSRVARSAGVTRESIYRATSDIGNPTLETLDAVLAAVGIRIKFEAENNAGDRYIHRATVRSEPAFAAVSTGKKSTKAKSSGQNSGRKRRS
jgi:probable addiction module antidote protein